MYIWLQCADPGHILQGTRAWQSRCTTSLCPLYNLHTLNPWCWCMPLRGNRWVRRCPYILSGLPHHTKTRFHTLCTGHLVRQCIQRTCRPQHCMRSCRGWHSDHHTSGVQGRRHKQCLTRMCIPLAHSRQVHSQWCTRFGQCHCTSCRCR